MIWDLSLVWLKDNPNKSKNNDIQHILGHVISVDQIVLDD